MEALTDLGDLMLRTADALCLCLADTPNGAPNPCSVYWGQSPPDDFACDCGTGQLDVWFEGYTAVNVFPQQFNGPIASSVGPLRSMAAIAVRLTRPCWPMASAGPDGNANIPSREETEPLSLNLAIDATAVWCCLLSNLASDDGTPSITGGPCSAVRMGLLVVDRNRGGCAGLTVRFQVDMGVCCVPPIGS